MFSGMGLTSREGILLELCSGTGREPEAPPPSFVLSELLDSAACHDILPLLASSLRSRIAASGEPLRAEQQGVLESVYAQSVIQFQLELSELRRTLTALSGIPTLVLKGPAIALRWHPPGARLARDLDLLIRSEHYPLARQRLSLLGYAVMAPYDERAQRRIGKDVGFIRTEPDGTTWSIELHWRFTEPGTDPLPAPSVWDRSVSVGDGQFAFQAPSTEDVLLLLALNLRKHRFARLKTLCDVHRLVGAEARNIDWDALHQRAHAGGICILMRHTLLLASSLLGTPSPNYPVCHRLRYPQAPLLRRLAGVDAVLSPGRSSPRYDRVAGLLPFVAVDHPRTIARLALARMLMTPEMASYRTGANGRFSSRAQYLRDTLGHLSRAFVATAASSDGLQHRTGSPGGSEESSTPSLVTTGAPS